MFSSDLGKPRFRFGSFLLGSSSFPSPVCCSLLCLVCWCGLKVLKATKALVQGCRRRRLEMVNVTECQLLCERWSSDDCQSAMKRYVDSVNDSLWIFTSSLWIWMSFTLLVGRTRSREYNWTRSAVVDGSRISRVRQLRTWTELHNTRHVDGHRIKCRLLPALDWVLKLYNVCQQQYGLFGY